MQLLPENISYLKPSCSTVRPAVVFIFITHSTSLLVSELQWKVFTGKYNNSSRLLLNFLQRLFEESQKVLRWNNVPCVGALGVQGLNYCRVEVICTPSFSSQPMLLSSWKLIVSSSVMKGENMIVFPFLAIFSNVNINFRAMTVTNVCAQHKMLWSLPIVSYSFLNWWFNSLIECQFSVRFFSEYIYFFTI